MQFRAPGPQGSAPRRWRHTDWRGSSQLPFAPVPPLPGLLRKPARLIRLTRCSGLARDESNLSQRALPPRARNVLSRTVRHVGPHFLAPVTDADVGDVGREHPPLAAYAVPPSDASNPTRLAIDQPVRVDNNLNATGLAARTKPFFLATSFFGVVQRKK